MADEQMDYDRLQNMHDEFWETIYEKQRLTKLLEITNTRIAELSQKMMSYGEKDQHEEKQGQNQ